MQQSIKEQIVEAIKAGLRQLACALYCGRLQDAYGDKSYLEGFVACAEVAGIIATDEGLAYRQQIQRVAKGERAPE